MGSPSVPMTWALALRRGPPWVLSIAGCRGRAYRVPEKARIVSAGRSYSMSSPVSA